jgi:hypothetical protein
MRDVDRGEPGAEDMEQERPRSVVCWRGFCNDSHLRKATEHRAEAG